MSDVYDYWQSLKPEKCQKCECSYLDFEDGAWKCELEECYQEEPISFGMEEDRGEGSDRDSPQRLSPEVTASSGDE